MSTTTIGKELSPANNVRYFYEENKNYLGEGYDVTITFTDDATGIEKEFEGGPGMYVRLGLLQKYVKERHRLE